MVATVKKSALRVASLLTAAALSVCAAGQRPSFAQSSYRESPPPQDGASPLAHAQRLEAAGLYSRALNAAVTGLKAAPHDKELYLYTLELLPETPSGQMEAFKAVTDRMMQTEKNYYGYYLGICKLQRSAGKITEALVSCRKALELDALPYPVYRESGLTWARAGNKAKAEEAFSQGVELFPGSYKAYLNRGLARERSGAAEGALKDFIGALDLLEKDTARRGSRATPAGNASFLRVKIKRLLQRLPRERVSAPVRPAKTVPAQARPPDSPVKGIDPEKCAQDFRSLLAAGGLDAALRASEACLKPTPYDPELLKDRAGLLVRLGRYEEGVDEYALAAKLYKKQPMAAFCRIKMAGTLLKLGRGAEAERAYKTVLETYPADLNALNGLAALFETRGDLRPAAGVYEKILSCEPSNAQARRRLAEIEAGLLTPEQVLAELKERMAVDQKKISPLPGDLKLFGDISAAERNGAVDYLKKRNPALGGLVLEKQSARGPRLFLTGAGYALYMKYLSRDAVAFFESKAITLRDIFSLRDNSGAPLFTKAGILTAEGAAALLSAGNGKKSWLLPYEALPHSPQAEKANKEIEAALGRGYREISEPEYLWLLKATDCPPEILQADPINMLVVNDGARPRYLLCYLPFPAVCSNAINAVLVPYIEKYRGGNDEIPNGNYSTAFFGTGAVKRRRFCEGGKIWTGK